MPARAGFADSGLVKKSRPRLVKTGRARPMTSIRRIPRTRSEKSRLPSSSTKKILPQTSGRLVRSECWTVMAGTAEPIEVIAASILLPRSTHERLPDDVQAKRQREQQRAHEEQAGEGELSAAHLVAADGQG